MAAPLVCDALWAIIEPLIPPEPPKPKGGRPRLCDRAALTGILFVAAHGYSLGASAGGDGLRLGYDLLAASARVASGWRVGTAASCAARPSRLCQR
ncbi:transposase (fragment), partial (plasmid) [Azospirillum baldaniorum]